MHFEFIWQVQWKLIPMALISCYSTYWRSVFFKPISKLNFFSTVLVCHKFSEWHAARRNCHSGPRISRIQPTKVRVVYIVRTYSKGINFLYYIMYLNRDSVFINLILTLNFFQMGWFVNFMLEYMVNLYSKFKPILSSSSTSEAIKFQPKCLYIVLLLLLAFSK